MVVYIPVVLVSCKDEFCCSAWRGQVPRHRYSSMQGVSWVVGVVGSWPGNPQCRSQREAPSCGAPTAALPPHVSIVRGDDIARYLLRQVIAATRATCKFPHETPSSKPARFHQWEAAFLRAIVSRYLRSPIYFVIENAVTTQQCATPPLDRRHRAFFRS